MKKLYLLRHAKSDWNDFTLDDHDRPLNERGKRDAAQIGQYIEKKNLRFDIIYCSTAVRTRETLSRLLNETDIDCPIEYLPDIYDANSSTLLSIIQNCPDKYNELMIVGHNPGMHILGLALSTEEKTPQRQQLEKHLPTGTLQDLKLNIDRFADISFDCGSLENLVRPKTLSSNE